MMFSPLSLCIFSTFFSLLGEEPTVTNCDISYNNSLQKCVIADVTGK